MTLSPALLTPTDLRQLAEWLDAAKWVLFHAATFLALAIFSYRYVVNKK